MQLDTMQGIGIDVGAFGLFAFLLRRDLQVGSSLVVLTSHTA